MVGVDGRFGRQQGALGGLHREVRRQAAVLRPTVHGAAGQGDPGTDLGDRRQFGADQVTGALGEDVVVVADGGGAALDQHAERALGGGGEHRGVDTGPGRVERDQPVEQVVVGGESAGEPLVEVVVGVDQAGGGQLPRTVDPADDVRQVRGGPARAHRLDDVPGDDDMAGGVLGVVGVDGGDGAVLDDDPRDRVVLDRAVRGSRCSHGASFFRDG